MILAAALGGFGVSRLFPVRDKAIAGSALRIRRMTTDPSSIWPAVSPDGKMVAYVARGDSQNFGIWVQHVGGGVAVRITEGVSDSSHIAFSADGSKIYYPSTSDPPGIYEVPVLGGEPRLVIPGAQHIQPSPDGRWLAYAHGFTVYVKPVAGGEARELTRDYWGYYWESCLVWSQDSSRLLVLLHHWGHPKGAQALAVFSLDGSKDEPRYALGANLRKRVFGTASLRLLAWLPGGDVVFSAQYGDATNLWRIPLTHAEAAEPFPVTIGPWSARMADLRGGHLVFANLRHTTQVWRLRADVNAGRVFGGLQRVTPELTAVPFPDVRPDGSALTYITLKGSSQGVFFLDLRTGKERTLVLRDRQAAAHSTFSPDGSRVAFMLLQWEPGRPAFVAPVAGGEPKFVGDAGGRIRGWSRDGRFLLIWRARTGPRTVGVLDLADGRVTDIIKSGFPIDGARFSPDSRWVAFLSAEEDPKPRLWIAPFRGAQPVPPTDWIEIAGGGTLPFWSPDGRSFYYACAKDNNPNEVVFFRQPLDNAGKPSGSPREFYSMRGHTVGGLLVNTICATKDHVYLLLESGQSDIWMMDLPQ